MKSGDAAEYISMDIDGVRGVLELLATEFDRMKKAKRAGKPVVGAWLNTPWELLLAADCYATTYRFEDLSSEIIKGRGELRNLYEKFNIDQCFCIDVCRSLGSPIIGAPRDYDLVVTDFTEKLPVWKENMGRYIDERWNYLGLEIPRGLSKSEALDAVREKLEALKSELERLTGRELSDEALREACEKTDNVRAHMARIDGLIKTRPMPVKGGDVWYAYFPMSTCYMGSEVEKCTELLASVEEEVRRRVEDGVAAYGEDVKRICAIPSGSNVTKDTYPVIERSGGALVTDWPCCEHGGLAFREPIKANGDVMDALARHYLKTFGIFDGKKDAEDVVEMVKRLDIDAVIYDVVPDLFGYAAPVLSAEEVKQKLGEEGIPLLIQNGGDRKAEIEQFLRDC